MIFNITRLPQEWGIRR